MVKFNILLNFIKNNIKGLILISFIVLFAQILSIYILIGSVTISIILGLIINYIYPLDKSFRKGINFSEKYLLSAAIIFMGASLDLSILSLIESKIIYNVIIVMIIAIISSLILGKIFNFSNSFSFLIGIGNGVCGSSAIAGASSILKSKKEDIVLSISIINILGSLGIFLVPLAIKLFFDGNTDNIGVIIGSTIQAFGQVAAAGFIMSNEIGELAVLVKMIRILFLGPILVILTLFYSFSDKNISKKTSFPIPPFIIGFLCLVLAVNFNLIPLFLIPILSYLSKYALLFAMAAVGLNISLNSMANNGPKVFLLALISFSMQIGVSIYLLS